MKNFLSQFSLSLPRTIVYMLQASEYNIPEYLKWLKRTKDFNSVMNRRGLDLTSKAKLLLIANYSVFLVVYLVVFILLLFWINYFSIFAIGLAVIVILLEPLLIKFLIIIPLFFGRVFIQIPKEKKLIGRAKQIISGHEALKIAIVGSFGKTTAKEILATVLATDKKVAFTPGNMNTPIGISRFAMNLSGDEDVLIFEMGEAKIGDIEELCELTDPDMGIITGINEAHLASFGTIENTVKTIFELAEYLGDKPIYKNIDSKILAENTFSSDELIYSKNGNRNWRVENIKSSLFGLEFDLIGKSESLKLQTKLVGEHVIGVIIAAVEIAKSLGLSNENIIKGVENTKPFEHRMQPRAIGGAWVIDDTYNGNSEGVSAGLALLAKTDAKRKIYVTPGLVEQGDKSAEIHQKIGSEIANVADVVVLMKNSVTGDIVIGLERNNYKGELKIIDNPLDFYRGIDHFIADGDVVLMQNDWTDNYA